MALALVLSGLLACAPPPPFHESERWAGLQAERSCSEKRLGFAEYGVWPVGAVGCGRAPACPPCLDVFALVAPCVRPRHVRAHPRSSAPLALACACTCLCCPLGLCPRLRWSRPGSPASLPSLLVTYYDRSLGRHGISLRENSECDCCAPESGVLETPCLVRCV